MPVDGNIGDAVFAGEIENSEDAQTKAVSRASRSLAGLKLILSAKRSSLGMHIGLVYSALALANLLFFLVMIYENQSDILLQLFRYRTEALVEKITKDMQRVTIDDSTEQTFARISKELELYDARSLILLNRKGKILQATPEIPAAALESVSAKFKEKIVQLDRSDSLYDTRNLTQLNEQDFSVSFLIPLELETGRHYVSATLNISSMHDRLRQMYAQAGIALTWVLLFHVGFAVYLFRLLIRRIYTLKKASQLLSDGDLNARALWKSSKGDELDDLGHTFNQMAEHIQTNITTIQTLNNQIQKELSIGKQVQSLIVNNSVDLQSYHPFVFYRPLREVSGDVFKFYKLGPNTTALFFGDACGHGVSAALITSLAITMLDNFIPSIMHPGRIIRKLADELNGSLGGLYYTTACFLVFAERQKRLYITNAGHLPPIILRPSNGKMVSAEATGPPAGTIEGFEYKTQAVDVKSGDLVVLYSDGITEAMTPEREIFGLERFQSLLRSCSTRTPKQIGELVVKELNSFTTHFHDDATLIILQVP